jgi:hypothetical protein
MIVKCVAARRGPRETARASILPPMPISLVAIQGLPFAIMLSTLAALVPGRGLAHVRGNGSVIENMGYM